MASGLSGRVAKIEHSLTLLGSMADRLRYLQEPTGRLVEVLAGSEQFARVGYLTRCRAHMQQGMRFPDSWRNAVQDSVAELGKDHAEILLPLGQVLGHTDLHSQLAALDNACALLEDRLEDARSFRDRHARLYQSLGVLSGIALVIVLI